MAAKRLSENRIFDRIDSSGQSILEFLFMLPVLITFSVVLTRMNTAIQISIVDQQYARAQALFLAFNSAVYPEIKYQQIIIREQMNQMLLGVAGNPSPEDGDYIPQATTQLVARSKKILGSNAPQEEPSLSQGRALVRIRNSVTLCTPTFFDGSGKPLIASASQPSALNDSTNFNTMCGSLKLKYE